MTRVGVLPYLWRGGELRIIVVSSRDGDRWVLPKGRPKSGMSRRALARLEAWEEAGLSGAFQPSQPIEVAIERSARRQLVRLYPLRVEQIAASWPERDDRRRRILPPPQAQDLLTDRGMARAVSALVRQLGAQPIP